MINFIGIIPARFASSRFPGKPLINIKGMSMIQRVYERAQEVLNSIVVATDDNRIFNEVIRFGGKAIMTSESHQSGTDRCFEALQKYQAHTKTTYDVLINIQGDEPFIRPEQIRQLMDCFNNSETDIATLIKKIDDFETIFNPNRPKVVTDLNGKALYFSRSAIPYLRNVDKQEWLTKHTFYQHIGMYAYRSHVLEKIISMKPGILEMAESLEQLRWLENSLVIQTAVTEYETFGIDTPEDLHNILSLDLF